MLRVCQTGQEKNYLLRKMRVMAPFKLENNSSSICKPCQNKSHDNLDNVWVEFPFDDDFFGDKEIASFDEKINNDAYKTDPVADWKAFNKRGLHLIHLNINSLLSIIII